MRRLIAVVTCHKYRARADMVRRTWAAEVGPEQADVRYFLGEGGFDGPLWPEEVRLKVPDDYEHLRHKVQAVMAWAVKQGYDHVFKTDDDVLVLPQRLFEQFVQWDYSGRVRGPSQENIAPRIYGQAEAPFCSGFGYWVSARSAGVAAASPDNGDWAEDRFVGQALARAGIRPYHHRTHLLWPPMSGHFCTKPNKECGGCVVQYSGASVICPHGRPDAVATLWRWYKDTGFIPTWLG